MTFFSACFLKFIRKGLFFDRVCITKVADLVLQFFFVKMNKFIFSKHSFLRNLVIIVIRLVCSLVLFSQLKFNFVRVNVIFEIFSVTSLILEFVKYK
mgnify:CR=1 FL=1